MKIRKKSTVAGIWCSDHFEGYNHWKDNISGLRVTPNPETWARGKKDNEVLKLSVSVSKGKQSPFTVHLIKKLENYRITTNFYEKEKRRVIWRNVILFCAWNKILWVVGMKFFSMEKMEYISPIHSVKELMTGLIWWMSHQVEFIKYQ